MPNPDLGALAEAIAERSRKLGLTTDIARLSYCVREMYEPVADQRAGHALCVGLGNGFEALYALLAGHMGTAVGVDPYLEGDGTSAGEHQVVLDLIAQYGLQDRLHIERASIDEYLRTTRESFDLVVCNEVLHHIFWLRDPLSRSDEFARSVALFDGFSSRSTPGARMIVGEVERYGLRPLLTRRGLLAGDTSYDTKQPGREWVRSASRAGWRVTSRSAYVPYALRWAGPLLSGRLGNLTVSHKYHLYFDRRPGPPRTLSGLLAWL